MKLLERNKGKSSLLCWLKYETLPFPKAAHEKEGKRKSKQITGPHQSDVSDYN